LVLVWPLHAFADNGIALGLITTGIYGIEVIGSIISTGYRLALTPDTY
jgi:hypothetical protein